MFLQLKTISVIIITVFQLFFYGKRICWAPKSDRWDSSKPRIYEVSHLLLMLWQKQVFFPTGKDKINICVVIHILLSQFLNTIASLQILKAGTYNDDLYLITTSAHEYKWNIFLTCSDTAAAKTERKSFLTRQAYYISNFFAWFHRLNYNWLLLLFMHYYMTRCSSGWPVQRPTVPAFSFTCSP